ncbi:hypothetical protein FRC00_013427 [Tulasnella sp. 408]|nr:hypothetical protein FRC00_013427 [Tulasnella sp. 408]
MGRPQGWCWDHFHKGDSKYKGNQTHWEARCRKCVDAMLQDMKNADAKALRDGVLERVRDGAQLMKDAFGRVDPVCGKGNAMAAHLKTCKWVESGVQKKAHKHNGKSAEPSSSDSDGEELSQLCPPTSSLSVPSRSTIPSANPTAAPKAPKPPKQTTLHLAPRFKWTNERTEEFNTDLCKFCVACNIPWNKVSNPQAYLFFDKWVPGSVLPD